MTHLHSAPDPGAPGPVSSDPASGCPSTPACHRALQGRLELLSQVHEGGARTWAEMVALVQSDLFRYAGRTGAGPFLRHLLGTPQFTCTTWTRLCGYLRRNRALRLSVYPLAKAVLRRLRHKYHIVIADYTAMGPGLYIGRFGGIYVNGDVVIGENCNISQQVVLGQANRMPRMGSPVLGDRVFLAAGSKVIGHVHLGDDSAIGANAVVTKDVPAGSVAVGVPAEVVSRRGSAGYINRLAP